MGVGIVGDAGIGVVSKVVGLARSGVWSFFPKGYVFAVLVLTNKSF